MFRHKTQISYATLSAVVFMIRLSCCLLGKNFTFNMSLNRTDKRMLNEMPKKKNRKCVCLIFILNEDVMSL